MELSIINFYLEPGNELVFANDCNRDLMRRLGIVLNTHIIDPQYLKYTLSINVSPSKRLSKIKIIGPSFDNTNRYINIVLRVPYKEIISSIDVRQKYKEIVSNGFELAIKSFKFIK